VGSDNPSTLVRLIEPSGAVGSLTAPVAPSGIMRIATAQLDKETLDALPRTTRWRALKRGWVCLGYNKKRIERNDEAFRFLASRIYNEARMVVRIEFRKGTAFPHWYDFDDLVQEIVIEVWRKSARPEFAIPGWRVKVMRGRLWDLRKSRKWERNTDEVST
jgi:hypothetical protein